MSNKVTINYPTGNIVCVNEVVQGQLTVGSLVGKNGGPFSVNSDMIVNGKTLFNGNVQALGGISSGSVPIWLGQDDIDLAGGTLVLSVSGTYQLKESVQGSFTVTASDVSLNMSGQTITPGLNSPLYGIQVTGNNFKGWNGTVKGFECGVWVQGTNGVDLRNVTVLNAIVPFSMAAKPAVALPAAVVPSNFAAGPAKRQSSAVPTLKKAAAKPQYNPSDTAKAAKAAFTKRAFGKKTSPNAKPAPKRANAKKVVSAKQAKWRDAHNAHTVLLKPSVANARLAAHVAAKAAKQRTWVGPHNGVPFAGVYISDCYNVLLDGVNCDNSAEVGIVLINTSGFSVQNVSVTNGNRGMTIIYCNAGYVNNVNLTGNTDISDYENSATLDVTNCYDVQCFNIQATSNYKGVYSETFDSNSGIVSVIGCDDVYFTDCSFSNNGSNYFESSYPTFSALLAFGNNNCAFKNCHMNSNFRNNEDMPGGYLETCACMYNINITFDGCTASEGNTYYSGESELTGWLFVANFGVTVKNCEASLLYSAGTTYNSYVEAFIFVYTMGLTVENCKAVSLSNYSDDSSGYVVHMGIYDGCDGAVVNGFQCDGVYSGCDQDNYGISVVDNYSIRMKNCSTNSLYSDLSRAIGINVSNTQDSVLDGCVSTGHYGDNYASGVYIENSSTCTVTNCVANGSAGHGFQTEGNCQQCTFQNNKANDNWWCGFLDDADWSNAWFGNTAANNDTNFCLYGNGNTYIFWSNDVWGGGNPWSTPGWGGAPLVPSSWDNVDIRYD